MKYLFLLGLLFSASIPLRAMPRLDAGSTADSTATFYAEGNVAALKAMLSHAQSREIDLLCRYRLYPLTEDDRYIMDLPTTLGAEATARELALLAALWGYRLRNASVFQMAKWGTRSHRLLEAAKAIAPDDPFVLLIEGQSLLFRPAIFGGDAQEAVARFRELRIALDHVPSSGISRMEADLWVWLALEKLGEDEAPFLREKLLATAPPPLYRQFLLSPP